MWSVGCVMAELMGRRPLFPGKDYVEMLKQITALTGNPSKEDQHHITEKASRFLADRSMFPEAKRCKWAEKFPKASAEAHDMLDQLLQFNPDKRLTADQALAHPYMKELHDPSDEPSAHAIFDFGFENDKLTLEQCRELVVQESLLFQRAGADKKNAREAT